MSDIFWNKESQFILGYNEKFRNDFGKETAKISTFHSFLSARLTPADTESVRW